VPIVSASDMLRSHPSSSALLGLAALIPSAALAQQNQPDPAPSSEIVLEEITISSSKGENVIGSASTVSVMDAQMLNRFGFRTIADAVDSRAGVSVQRTYFKQGMLTGRGVLQDLYANKNLILIDGIPLWHAVSGESNIDRVALTDAKRIEVLRGPASVVYGSQAYTSALNIVLKRPEVGDRAGEIYSGVGTNGAYEGGLNFRYGADNGVGLVVAANGSRGQRAEHTFTDEANVSRSVDTYLDVSNLTLRGSFRKHTIVLNRYDNRESTYGPSASHASGAGDRHDVEGFAVGYRGVQPLSDVWSLEGLAFYDWNERDYPRLVSRSERSRITGYRTGGMLKGMVNISEAYSAEFGADYENRVGEQFSTYSPTTFSSSINNRAVWERSGFAQLEWKNPRGRIVAGTRYSENATTGSHLTSRITGVYQFNDTESLKLIAGESYRSPSLLEMYSLTSSVRGNPDLDPETARSLELSYQTKRDKLFTQVLAYYAEYDSKIFRVTDPLNPARNTYVNGQQFTAIGVELEISYTFEPLGEVFLTFDAVEGSDDDAVPDSANPGTTSFNFKYVPRYNLAAGWAKSFGSVGVSLVARHTPATHGPKERVGSFTLVDAAVTYRHDLGSRIRITHRVSAENVLGADEAYPEFSRRRLNEVRSGYDAAAYYRLTASF
jgi:outer membrane cobalamin receptor